MNTIIYSFFAGAITLFGTFLVLWNETVVRKYTAYIISFAAGVMLATSFFHLILHAFDAVGSDVFSFVLIGFLSFYLVEHFVMFHPCHDEKCEFHKLGIVSFIGLFVHSLLDGVAIAVGFEVGHGVGVLTAVSVILHEMPEGISISGILFHTGEKRKKILVYSTLVAAATPIGAIFFKYFAVGLSENILAILLSYTAGSFIYISASDLIPEAHKRQSRLIPAVLLLGVVVVFIGGKLLHNH